MKFAWLLLSLSVIFSSNLSANTSKTEFDGYIVKFKKNVKPKIVLKSFGPNQEIVKTSFGTFARLDKIPSKNSNDKSFIPESDIEYIEPNYIVKLAAFPINDYYFYKQWSLENIGYTSLPNPSNSKEIKVAVIDTGVDYSHPDLKNQMLINEIEAKGKPGVDDDQNGYVDDIYGYDFKNKESDPMDDDVDFHGTHCAGVIAAEHNKIGIAGLLPKGKILALKAIGPSRSGTTGTYIDVISAIDYAILRGVHIISNSYGSTDSYSRALEEAIEKANANGIIFVAAAGNDNSNNDNKPHYPSSYKIPNVISVGAISENGKIADFSNYGKTSVDVLAPGVDIFSTIGKNNYAAYNGTSMATPLVAGMIGLMLDRDLTLTPAELKTHLMTGASKDKNSGFSASGNVNLYKSLSLYKEISPFSIEGNFSYTLDDQNIVKFQYNIKKSDADLTNKKLYLYFNYIKKGQKVREWIQVSQKGFDNSEIVTLNGFAKNELYRPEFKQTATVELVYLNRVLAKKEFTLNSKPTNLHLSVIESSLENLTAKVAIEFRPVLNADLVIPSGDYTSYEILNDTFINDRRKVEVLFKGINKDKFKNNTLYLKASLKNNGELVEEREVQVIYKYVTEFELKLHTFNFATGEMEFSFDVTTPAEFTGMPVSIQVYNTKTSNLIYTASDVLFNDGYVFKAKTKEYGIDPWHFIAKKWFNIDDGRISTEFKVFVEDRLQARDTFDFKDELLKSLNEGHAIKYFADLVNEKFTVPFGQFEPRTVNTRSIIMMANDAEVNAADAQKENPWKDNPDQTILGKVLLEKKKSSHPEFFKVIGENALEKASKLSLFKRSAYKQLAKEIME
jgi:subtilisin family serine protease